MKNKHVSGIVIIAVITGLSAATYFLYKNKKVSYAKAILKYGGNSNYAFLLSAEEGYLKSWAKELKAGKTAFEYNGKKYNTQGGKAA